MCFFPTALTPVTAAWPKTNHGRASGNLAGVAPGICSSQQPSLICDRPPFDDSRSSSGVWINRRICVPSALWPRSRRLRGSLAWRGTPPTVRPRCSRFNSRAVRFRCAVFSCCKQSTADHIKASSCDSRQRWIVRQQTADQHGSR